MSKIDELDRVMNSLESRVRRCVQLGCHPTISDSIIGFSKWILESHSFCHGNDFSIFSGLHEVERCFNEFISTSFQWAGKELIEKFRICSLGKDAAITAKHNESSDPISLHIEEDIFKAENIIILSIKLSFKNDLQTDGHHEYISTLETIRCLLEFIRTRKPKRLVFYTKLNIEYYVEESPSDELFSCELCFRNAVKIRIKDDDDNDKRTVGYFCRQHFNFIRKRIDSISIPDRYQGYILLKSGDFDSFDFCSLCWRQARHSPLGDYDGKPMFCRIHNQDRVKIAKNFNNISDCAPSQYRSALKHKDSFLRQLSRLQSLILLSDVAIAVHKQHLYARLMFIRYLAYRLSKREHLSEN